MQKKKKKQLHSWLRIGSIGCLVQKMTTIPPPTNINCQVDEGVGWNRRRPLPIPTLLRIEGGDRERLVNLSHDWFVVILDFVVDCC
jgi:hypothetical protein